MHRKTADRDRRFSVAADWRLLLNNLTCVKVDDVGPITREAFSRKVFACLLNRVKRYYFIVLSKDVIPSSDFLVSESRENNEPFEHLGLLC